MPSSPTTTPVTTVAYLFALLLFLAGVGAVVYAGGFLP